MNVVTAGGSSPASLASSSGQARLAVVDCHVLATRNGIRTMLYTSQLGNAKIAGSPGTGTPVVFHWSAPGLGWQRAVGRKWAIPCIHLFSAGALLPAASALTAMWSPAWHDARRTRISNLIPANAYVAVADGGGGTLFRNTDLGGVVSLPELQRLSPRDLADDDPIGSRPEKQTPGHGDEANFAKYLAQALLAMRARGEYKDTVQVLNPQAICKVWSCAGKEVEASVGRTVSKDSMNSPAKDFEKAASD
ncbi:MAG TPA: hypothetical protein VGC15_21685 [Acetobacteraceae bacterium]